MVASLRSPSLSHRLVRIAALIGVLVCGYAALGSFAAPALLRHALVESGSERSAKGTCVYFTAK